MSARRGRNVTGRKSQDGAAAEFTRPKVRSRRWARAAVAVVLVGVLAGGLALLLTPTKRNEVRAILDNCTDPPPEPGPARPWEAEIDVSTYSSANTRNGNLFTVIPIIGWSGGGPDMNMALYHNSANVEKPAGWTDNVGFDLGPGWTVAYSDQLILNLPDEVTVVHDDGTEDVFTWNAATQKWDPPAGVHDVLTQDGVNPDYWKLTHKDQSGLKFSHNSVEDVVRLVERFDATGQAALIQYTTNAQAPNRVTSASGGWRALEFQYDATGRLERIFDPREETCAPSECTIEDREWTFSYDANGRLSQIADPLDNVIDITYDVDGRIETITDKHEPGLSGDTYTYEYYGTGYLLAPGRICG